MVARQDACAVAFAMALFSGWTSPAGEPAPAAAPEPAGKAPPATVYRAAAPPTIDGILDDECWRAAGPVGVRYRDDGGGVPGPDMMTFRLAWDELYLYVGYETRDEDLRARGSGEWQGPLANRRAGACIWDESVPVDVVEFFLSFGDEHVMWEFHHNALDQWNDVLCIVPAEDWPFARSGMLTWGIYLGTRECVEDDGRARFASAVRLAPKADGEPSTVNEPGDVDAGYSAEIRLPWRGIGAPEKARVRPPKGSVDPSRWGMKDVEFSFLGVSQNPTGGTRYFHSSPTRRGGWFHKSYAHWPRYRCVEGTE